MHLSKLLPIVMIVAGSLAIVAAPVSAAPTPPRGGPPPRVHEIGAGKSADDAVPPRRVRRRAARELRRRTVVARTALSGSEATLQCSYGYSQAWMVIPLRATFGARTGEQLFVRRWYHIWSPTRDQWIYSGDTWQQANPSAYGEWNGVPQGVRRGEWVSAVLETWSPSTGPRTWWLRPYAYEPLGFGSLVQFSNEWCLPWP
jgi:hypothetical protein